LSHPLGRFAIVSSRRTKTNAALAMGHCGSAAIWSSVGVDVVKAVAGALRLGKTRKMQFAIVATRSTTSNAALANGHCAGIHWTLLNPTEALERLVPGDVALGRLDVRTTLDGVEDGLWALGALAARGIRVLNGPNALLAAHDKLLTARLLHRVGLPHPRTRLATAGATPPPVSGPVVVKPRFGSWGRAVYLCADADELVLLLERLRAERWFRTHGAVVQELIQPQGFDLRVVVAGGVVVGAISRVAPPGEWRTNVALGARRLPVDAPPDAQELALEAAAAADADLVGVDLLPDGHGGWTIIELNGAVEFTRDYALAEDVFAAASFSLARVALDRTVAAVPAAEPAALG
jgi:RimK family alpha-L-glutamate ligase